MVTANYEMINKLYPVPMKKHGSSDFMLHLHSQRAKAHYFLKFSARPADSACGAYHMWMPYCSSKGVAKQFDLASWKSLNSIDIDKAIPSHQISNQREFELYAWNVLGNGVMSYGIWSGNRSGMFCQDGSRGVVDRLMDVIVNQSTFIPWIVSDPHPNQHEFGYHWCQFSPNVQESEFFGSHDIYKCKGYCVDFGGFKKASQRKAPYTMYNVANMAAEYGKLRFS